MDGYVIAVMKLHSLTFPVPGGKCGNATDELLHWQLRSPCHGLHMSVQDEEEEAEPEQPAKKPVKEEAVFAGNKNLRSEDQKYREINDDRQVIPTHMPEFMPARRSATTACLALACQDFPASTTALTAATDSAS